MALFTVGIAAGCYSDPINSPPNPPQIMVPTSIGRGQSATFTAQATDPDGDRLKLTWTSGPGPCDPAALPATNGIVGPSYPLIPNPDAAGQLCVVVTATDPYGASATQWTTVSIANRPPTARITVQQLVPDAFGRYDLYSTFRLSGADSSDDDGDPLTYRWRLLAAPDPSHSVLANCDASSAATGDGTALIECLGPILIAGAYTIELVVNDGAADSAAATLTLTVNGDRAPCMTRVAPADPSAAIVWDPSIDKTFEVQNVSDDGSPYPSADPPDGPAIFSWSLRRVGDASWESIAGYALLPSVAIPGGRFTIGDSVEVRVEVRDQATHAIDDLAACGVIATCPADCPERVTWRIDYR